MASCADLRVTTTGPSDRGPAVKGPQRTSSQGRPVRSTGATDAGASRISTGGRCRSPLGDGAAGSTSESRPTKAAKASRAGMERRQIRDGTPLNSVTSSSTPTRARRQRGPAITGVTKNARVHSSFRRGSSRCSQLNPSAPEVSTYCPMGIWRSQSISCGQLRGVPDPAPRRAAVCLARRAESACPQSQAPPSAAAPRSGGRCRQTAWDHSQTA